MNLRINFIKLQRKLQEVSNTWTKEITPFLPENLEEIAKETGLLYRKRGITSTPDILKVFFLYAVSGISFRMLAAAAHGLQISSISDTAWRKKLSKGAPFLRNLLNTMLSSYDWCSNAGFFENKNVLLIDGSIIRQNGKKQHQQRIHLCYSLNHNQMDQIHVTDHHTAESFEPFSLKKEDLVLADAGYGKARNYAYAREQGCDVILRITPSHFRMEDQDGKIIDLESILRKAKKNGEQTIEQTGFCQYKNKRYFVRVIAQELPKGKAEAARKRKKRKARKTQCNIQEKTLLYADYVIVITSLGMEYDREEILYLYRSRWQVELLLKRFKQNLQITTIRMANECYAESMVLLWLILWTMTEQKRIRRESMLKKKEERIRKINISCWEESKLDFLQIKEILCLSWSRFVDVNNEGFYRFLSMRNRHRINQNHEFHMVILPGLIS